MINVTRNGSTPRLNRLTQTIQYIMMEYDNQTVSIELCYRNY